MAPRGSLDGRTTRSLYVVGRVILPFMFVSILVYFAGLSFILAPVVCRLDAGKHDTTEKLTAPR